MDAARWTLWALSDVAARAAEDGSRKIRGLQAGACSVLLKNFREKGGRTEESSEPYGVAVWVNSNRQEQWMSELYLGLSEKFYGETDGIRAGLSKHLKVSRAGCWSR